MPAPYGWMIDVDHCPVKDAPVGTNGNARNVTGPHGISPDILKRLHADEGRRFRMYNADGELVYTGRIITPASEEEGEMDFAPLDDFGQPNAGAVEIHYLRPDGKTWYEL